MIDLNLYFFKCQKDLKVRQKLNIFFLNYLVTLYITKTRKFFHELVYVIFVSNYALYFNFQVKFNSYNILVFLKQTRILLFHLININFSFRKVETREF